MLPRPDVGAALDSRTAKALSLLVAAACVWRACSHGDEYTLRIALALILALSLIWFGKYIEHYRGWASFRVITELTPAVLLQLMGWVLLALNVWLIFRTADSAT